MVVKPDVPLPLNSPIIYERGLLQIREFFHVYVVENYPNYEYSGYTHQLVWIDKARYIPLKVEYYDRKGALLKTQQFNEYRKYLGQYWRSHQQVMENHQSGKITLLKLEEYRFQTGLRVRDFDRNALKRVR